MNGNVNPDRDPMGTGARWLRATSMSLLTMMAPVACGHDAAEPGRNEGIAARETINDAWLEGRIESALLFNEYLAGFAIDTDVEDGVARLRGVVASDIDRDLAGEIARSIDGIRQVRNRLEVDEQRARERAMARDDRSARDDRGFRAAVLDATLTARVKSKLLLNNNTSGTAIDVDSARGIVTLSGKVPSDQVRELAVRIAGNTEGADSVVDHLTVRADNETS